MNLTKEELDSLKPLSKNDSLIIQQSDKRNSIIITKDDYSQKMQTILSDCSKFSEIYIAEKKAFECFNQHREINYRSP